MKAISFYIKSLEKIIWAVIVLLLLNSYEVIAQAEKENEYRKLRSVLEFNNEELDSLNRILSKKVELISQLKTQPDRDEKEIKKLLASTASLTNSIEKYQIEIDSLNILFSKIKSELFNIYSGQIDSLNQSKLSVSEKRSLTTKLIEKRLRVSPKIDMLSFNPEKVLNIDELETELGRTVYKEFLSSAYDEVELKLNEINSLKDEIATILVLNEETVSFLDEAEFDNDISYFNSNIKSSNDYRETSIEGSNNYDNSLAAQTKSFSEILTQLETIKIQNDYVFSLDNISINNNLIEFKKLVEQVETQLTDYKIVINNKLKSP